eukprot:1161084-Rhodomonas_salina.3
MKDGVKGSQGRGNAEGRLQGGKSGKGCTAEAGCAINESGRGQTERVERVLRRMYAVGKGCNGNGMGNEGMGALARAILPNTASRLQHVLLVSGGWACDGDENDVRRVRSWYWKRECCGEGGCVCGSGFGVPLPQHNPPGLIRGSCLRRFSFPSFLEGCMHTAKECARTEGGGWQAGKRTRGQEASWEGVRLAHAGGWLMPLRGVQRV